MTWLIAVLAVLTLLLSAFSVYKTKRLESTIKPQVRLLAPAPR